jgi:hypothetical protein
MVRNLLFDTHISTPTTSNKPFHTVYNGISLTYSGSSLLTKFVENRVLHSVVESTFV